MDAGLGSLAAEQMLAAKQLRARSEAHDHTWSTRQSPAPEVGVPKSVAALRSTPYTSQAHVPGGNNVELVVPPAVSEEEFAAAVADIREEIDQLRGGVTATTGSVGKALEDIGGLTDAVGELKSDLARETQARYEPW